MTGAAQQVYAAEQATVSFSPLSPDAKNGAGQEGRPTPSQVSTINSGVIELHALTNRVIGNPAIEKILIRHGRAIEEFLIVVSRYWI